MTPDFESALSNVPSAESFAELLRKRLAENHDKAATVIRDVAKKLGDRMKALSMKSEREVRVGLAEYDLNEDPLHLVISAFANKGYKVEHLMANAETEGSEELVLRW